MQPYRHQIEALEAMRDKRAFALLMSMRTGKSKVVLDEWVEKAGKGEAKDLLVVAPAGAYRTWQREIEKHVDMDVEVLLWDSEDSPKKRQNLVAYLGQPNGHPQAFLVNVEALSTIEEAREACYKVLLRGETIFVVDESTTIKNPNAIRTKHVCAMAPKAKWRRILSGLPTPTSPLDLFSQFWFLDPMILRAQNFFAFKMRYAVTQKIKVGVKKIKVGGKIKVVARYAYIVVGYRNVDELTQKIAPHSFRRQLKDCYDVPNKVYIRRDVELTDEQKRMYLDLKARATTKLESGEHVTATEVITQMLRLHQICCGHVVDEDGQLHEVKTNRIDALMDVLQECDGKVVIWCSYRHDVEKITARLQRDDAASVAQFWGGNIDVREDESRRFETDPQCKYMVATPGAGGRGRTWSVADYLVYYSNTDNLEHRDQSEERASGIGKEQPVTVIDLIARGTVDEKIVGSLRQKINMASKITGDNYREWLI